MSNGMSGFDVSATGMSAERYRLEVIANNIANAQTTRTKEGGPFKRQDVLFSSLFEKAKSGSAGKEFTGGVQITGLFEDESEPVRIFNPGHPDADAEGYLLMPNVQVPMEMVNLISASRGYEANLRAMQAFRQIAEQALNILRG